MNAQSLLPNQSMSAFFQLIFNIQKEPRELPFFKQKTISNTATDIIATSGAAFPPNPL